MLTIHPDHARLRRLPARSAAALAAVAVLSSCTLPFAIGQPTTRALESGAADSLDAAKSFRIAGSYTDPTDHWTIDMELVRPGTRHLTLSGRTFALEAIVTEGYGGAFFRGQKFLSTQLGSDPLSRNIVQATGDAWWRGPASIAPELPDFTKGSSFRSTFLGTSVTSRTDHVSDGGVAAIELSGPRADVFIAEAAPHRILRVIVKKGAVIDGFSEADLRYSDFDRNFDIVVRCCAINFADLSTLPPIYTVQYVDTSGCGSPCVVSASLKNLGGTRGARGPSSVTFKMTDPASGAALGSCEATVQPDVDHSAATTASCTIGGVSGKDHNAAEVTATTYNPGHA